MNTYLAAYDISNDGLRRKMAGKLLEFGLERWQYSVFLGPLSRSAYTQLHQILANLFSEADPKRDAVMLIPVSRRQLERMEVFGAHEWDIDYITQQKHVLFI